jgi:glycosyltransferase involved in cell wall biosynthesis
MILSCIVTHNRFALTKLTIESYLNATSVDHFLVVVDNDSTDETYDYLQDMYERGYINHLLLYGENLYPGKACNIGWEEGLKLYPQAEFLHRSDNDIIYQTNWDKYSIDKFRGWPELGQFGILDLKDQFYPGCTPCYETFGVNIHFPNVGGNHLTRRELWDHGLRHIEVPWDQRGDEDVQFSQDVANMGFYFGHSTEHIATHLGVWWGNFKDKDYREYYRRTYKERLKKDIYPDIPVGDSEF